MSMNERMNDETYCQPGLELFVDFVLWRKAGFRLSISRLSLYFVHFNSQFISGFMC